MYYRHGHTKNGRVTSEYCIWCNMLCRCNNPNVPSYKDYGNRGIKVCERWNDFRNFFTDMGSRPNGLTLDRRDNNKGYGPDNCCWATRKEQRANQREPRDRKNQFFFCGFGPNDEVVIGNNQRKFARIYGLDGSNISACLRGKYQTTKGWRFKRI